MSNVGFRIFTNFARPPQELIQAFSGLPVANIADNMNRMSCVGAEIKNYNTAPLLGSAFTLRSRTADNLMFQKALDMAQPGDVIVVDVQGDVISAVTGEIMVRYAMKKGLAGFIIDGAIRDVGTIRGLDFPVYARGATPKGPYKEGPGEINVAVSCGGVVIRPGDILVGDEDGVVVINPADAAELAEKAKRTLEREQTKLTAIEHGTEDRSWIDRTLQEKGCEFID